MKKSILVNFHTHSHFSDGDLAPEILAANLAAAGVRCAALTDHDSVDGVETFQDVLKKRGVASICGVELTTQFNGREAHLLGYGFNPGDPELLATLVSLRQVKYQSVQSIAESIRKAGSGWKNGNGVDGSSSAAPNGVVAIEDAIALIHRAGGKAFWAHPWAFESDPDILEDHLETLLDFGLDGIEVGAADDSAGLGSALRDLAEKHGLLIGCGTDFHSSAGADQTPYGVEMPWDDWIKFRDMIFSTSGNKAGRTGEDQFAESKTGVNGSNPEKRNHDHRRSYGLRILVPTLSAILLFIATIWGIILPSFERTLLDRKREMIQELTNSAWSILSSYEQDERNGLMTRDEAQSLAISRIEDLRYGPEGKDYFWVQDMTPRMVMHPYRPDLNGQDLHGITDARGVKIFIEFADLVRRNGEGYINYVWQWKDDPQRLEPKESFVKGFPPWNWIIGTGIYVDDVTQEIARIERSLVNTSLVISGVIVLLLAFVLQQSLRIEKERQEVVDNLQDSTERFHSLVEATTEGTLLVLEDRCRYANPTFLSMVGYSARQLEFLQFTDLIPDLDANQDILNWLAEKDGDQAGQTSEGILMRSDGSQFECVCTINPIKLAGQSGYIFLAKDITRSQAAISYEGLAEAVNLLPIGIFRALAARRGVFLDLNQEGRNLLLRAGVPDTGQAALADIFPDSEAFEHFIELLQAEGVIKDRLVYVHPADSAIRTLSISASLLRDEQNRALYIDGIIEDVSVESGLKAGREALIKKLQSSLLFLHEPIANVKREIVSARMDTTVEQLARIMTSRNAAAALVASESDTIIGIVTDQDLRERVLAENVPLSAPIHTIMSAPLVKIPESALVYEALTLMEEKGVRHLAVEGKNGLVTHVIDTKALVQFHEYGPIVLPGQISRAKSAAEVAQTCEQIPVLIRALQDSSARPRHVTNMLGSIYDSATERLIQLAIDDLGVPPVKFSFIAMGSQGRQEPTLLTDQDNGIIFLTDREDDLHKVSDYFLQLGKRVSQDLDNAGYHFCRGKVMADNPRWCRSLDSWLQGFDEWVKKKEPQEIIDISIFLDFRSVYGDPESALLLRKNIYQRVENEPGFFHYFAQNTLSFKPPVRLPGNIYLGGGTDHAGEINLKDAMMPIVSFARLYALRHQIPVTHTLDRIAALEQTGIILPSSRDEISAAYDFLIQLRIEYQLEAIQAGRPPENVIRPSQLDHIQREMLKHAFNQITAIQKKVSYDFLGGMA